MSGRIKQNPIERRKLTNKLWSGTRTADGVADLVMMSDSHLLIYRGDGRYGVFQYDPAAGPTAEPFAKELSSGQWLAETKKAVFSPKTRFLPLGPGVVLTFHPLSDTKTDWRLWRWDSKAQDPLTKEIKRTNPGDMFETVNARSRLFKIGGRVVNWRPKLDVQGGPQKAEVFVYRIGDPSELATNPIPHISQANWDDIGMHHEVVPLASDRVVVWEPATGNFRVFAWDSKRDDPLVRPPLAEGSWAGDIQAQPGARASSPAYSLAQEGRRLMLLPVPGTQGRAFDYQPASGQVFVWPLRRVDEMPEGDTDLPGVRIAAHGKARLFEVDLVKVFGKQPKVREIGEKFALSPDEVMADLCCHPKNVDATRAFYQNSEPNGGCNKTWPGDPKEDPFRKPPVPVVDDRQQKAAKEIFKEGVTLSKWKGDVLYKTRPHYDGWTVTVPRVFLRVTSRTIAAVDVDSKQNARQKRLDDPAIKSRLSALSQKLMGSGLDGDGDPIGFAGLVEFLYFANENVLHVTRAAGEELGLLRNMQLIAEMMLKDGRPEVEAGSDVDQKLRKLIVCLENLCEKHEKHTMTEAPHLPMVRDTRSRRDRLARKVLAFMERQEFVDDCEVLARNLDIADRDLVCNVYDHCRTAYAELDRTPLAREVEERHLDPTLEAICAVYDRTFDAKAAQRTGNAGFDEELRREADPTPKNNLLTKLVDVTGSKEIGKGAQLVTPVAGNAPGPASIMGTIMTLSMPQRLARHAGDARKAGTEAAKAYKAVAWMLGFTADQEKAALKSIFHLRHALSDDARKAAMAQARSAFGEAQSGPKITFVLVVLNGIALLNAVQAHDSSGSKDKWVLLDEWLAIAGTGTQLGATLAQQVARSSWIGRYSGTAEKLGGKVLGPVAALITCATAVKSALNERDQGDQYSQVLAWINAGGAVLSYAGMVMCLTGVGAVYGTPVMLVGAALTAGASLCQYIKEKTDGPHGLFRLYLRQLYAGGFVKADRTDDLGNKIDDYVQSPFAWARDEEGKVKSGRDRELNVAYENVSEAISFTGKGWMPFITAGDLTPPAPGAETRTAPVALRDAGLRISTIALLCERTEDQVKAVLEEARRTTTDPTEKQPPAEVK